MFTLFLYLMFKMSLPTLYAYSEDYCSGIITPSVNNSLRACENCTKAGCTYCSDGITWYCRANVPENEYNECHISYTGDVCSGIDFDDFDWQLFWGLVIPLGSITIGVILFLLKDKILGSQCCDRCTKKNGGDQFTDASLQMPFAQDATNHAQMSLEELIDSGVSLHRLRELGYTPSQLKGRGNFQFQDFVIAEYSREELKAAGFI